MKKKALQIQSIRDVKSIHSAGLSSIPKVQRSTYLELYTLQREKDRLEKEVYALKKREASATRQIESVDRRMDRLHKEARKGLKGSSQKKLHPGPLKTISIKY